MVTAANIIIGQKGILLFLVSLAKKLGHKMCIRDRWYTNTPLMLGSIGALCAAAAAVTLLIWREKRRGREAAEAEEEGATDI